MTSTLKQARINSGKTIEKVVFDLKIKKQYLIALEEEKLDIIPAKVYVKGYLKLYSNYLGIPLSHNEEVLKEIEEFPEKTIVITKHNKVVFKSKWKNHLIIISILAMIIIYIIFHLITP